MFRTGTDESWELRRRDAVRTQELLSLPDAGPCRRCVPPARIALRACDGMSPSGSPRARPHFFVGTVAVQWNFPPRDNRLAEPACRPSRTVPGRNPHAAVGWQRPAGPGLGRRSERPGARARGASRHSLDAMPPPGIRVSTRSSSATCLGLIDPAGATTEDSRVAGSA